jgi:F0F1-type ATP synthase assembly protein I
MEYAQDRLKAEIRDLRKEIDKMEAEFEVRQREALIGEIVICIVVFFVGLAFGWMIDR